MFCDLHADTPTRLFTEHKSLSDPTLNVNTQAIQALSAPLVQIFAIWHNPESPKNSDAVLDYFLETLQQQNTFHLAKSTSEMQQLLQKNKSVALLSIEGGNILQKDLSRLDDYYQKGVRFFTLVWNGENDLAGAAGTDDDLTPLGRRALKRMRALGILPDLSHCNEKSFWSTAAYGGKLFCSHSNAQTICNHPRNLTDAQIRAIIASDGLIGLTLYPPFVNGTHTGTLKDLLAHIDHICSLGGIENLAIGSDLDGMDFYLSDGKDSSFFGNLAHLMAKNGFSESQIRKILGENFFTKICNF